MSKPDILIVDDRPDNLRFLSAMLTEQGYGVRQALNGKMALTAVQTVAPDLILLDIMMPKTNGYDICKQLKSDPETAEIPVIFLSALDDVFDKVKAFEAGGADYITKPFQFEEVVARVNNQLALRQARQQVQELNTQLEARVKRRTRQLEEANSQLLDLNSKLLDLALRDRLTGLPNRTSFVECLDSILQRYKSDRISPFAILFLDCDRFKVINDSLGHPAGDRLLIEIARRLRSALPESSTLARTGGDEFAALLENIADPEEPERIANTILEQLKPPFDLQGKEVFMNASIGIVMGSADYEKPEHLLRDADAAMYRAKAKGKACYQLFDAAMHERAIAYLQLETDLRRAIERQEFVVFYQPIVDLKLRRVCGFEALVRWQHPDRGFVSPGEFIPAAEETGAIVPMGLLVMKQACIQLRQWRDRGLFPYPITISVNLSVKQFSQPDLVDCIDSILHDTGLEGQCLKLEITESAIMEDPRAVGTILERLRKRHIGLSIDDFGTGYSSLSYLDRLPVNTLKIDRSFVDRMEKEGNDGIVGTIVTLARNFHMETIAEGVETQQQLQRLRALGCDCAQGYLLSRPVAAEDVDRTISILHQQSWFVNG